MESGADTRMAVESSVVFGAGNTKLPSGATSTRLNPLVPHPGRCAGSTTTANIRNSITGVGAAAATQVGKGLAVPALHQSPSHRPGAAAAAATGQSGAHESLIDTLIAASAVGL
jgi:hypothetical protein